MDNSTQIGNIVAADYRAASVFKKYGIDFCCGGGITVSKACERKGIDAQAVLADLATLEQKEGNSKTAYNNWKLNELIDHILTKHHAYTRRTIGELEQYLQKVARVHGDHNPELKVILKNFELLAEELIMHMQKEEVILFPYIRSMEESAEKSAEFTPPPFGTIQNPIRMMESEHDGAGDLMKEIRALSNDFVPPVHACNTYMVSFKLLEEFETDLHKHIHLENNILFPKAVEMERKIL